MDHVRDEQNEHIIEDMIFDGTTQFLNDSGEGVEGGEAGGSGVDGAADGSGEGVADGFGEDDDQEADGSGSVKKSGEVY